MKKYLIIALVIIAAFLCMGCNDDSSAPSTPSAPGVPAGPGMPSATPGAPAGPGMPSATPGAPAGPGMPSATPGAPAGPGMPSATPGMDAAADTAAAPAEEGSEMKTLETENPNARVVRDKSGEVRSYYNPDAMKREEKTHLSELKSREVALDFIRANYYYFDSMSFETRPDAGKLVGGVYKFKWVQIIRETKKTGNTIEISVNPYSGKVVRYSSTRRDWTN